MNTNQTERAFDWDEMERDPELEPQDVALMTGPELAALHADQAAANAEGEAGYYAAAARQAQLVADATADDREASRGREAGELPVRSTTPRQTAIVAAATKPLSPGWPGASRGQ